MRCAGQRAPLGNSAEMNLVLSLETNWPGLANFLVPDEPGTKIFFGAVSHVNTYHTLQATLSWKCSGGCGIASNRIPSPCSRERPCTLEAVGKLWSFPSKDHSSTPEDKPCYQTCGTAVTWAVAAWSTWMRPAVHKITMLFSLEKDSKRLNLWIKCRMQFVCLVECFANVAKKKKKSNSVIVESDAGKWCKHWRNRPSSLPTDSQPFPPRCLACNSKWWRLT